MKQIAYFLVACALFSATAHGQSAPRLQVTGYYGGCGLPQNPQIDFPALERVVDANASLKCKQVPGQIAVRLSGYDYTTPHISGMGPTNCSPVLVVQARATYTCR